MVNTVTNIVILDDYQRVAMNSAEWDLIPGVNSGSVKISTLDTPLVYDAIDPLVSDAHILVTMRERTWFSSSLLGQLPQLRMIAGTGRRQANVDLDAATTRGILICTTDSGIASTIELTWGLILAIARRIPQHDKALRDNKWQAFEEIQRNTLNADPLLAGTELRGKTLGLLGVGRIGGGGARLGSAFGMDVIAWTPNLTDKRAFELGISRVEREVLFRTADIISLHVPLNENTKGIVGFDEIAMMKPSSILVNTSRGPIVDEKALINGLKEHHIWGAGIDVFDQEPLPPDHQLLGFPNVVLTPHIGYVSAENYSIMYQQCVENIVNFLAGEPSRVLNREVLNNDSLI